MGGGGLLWGRGQSYDVVADVIIVLYEVLLVIFAGCEWIIGWSEFVRRIHELLIGVVRQLDGCVLNGITGADGALRVIFI